MERIGFGCVRLTSNFTERQAIRNLEVAYDHGIRHFDVARLYGFGLAEGILGKFASGKSDITITTKFGLFPNSFLLKNLFVQNVLRGAFRAVKKSSPRAAGQRLANSTIARRFSVEDARASLETSLRELQKDRVDHLLLHEATVAEANDEALIEFLEEQKSRGTIGEYGVGSFSEAIAGDVENLPAGYTVLQTDNSFPNDVSLKMISSPALKKRFYFSPFRFFRDVEKLLRTEPQIARHAAEILNCSVESAALDIILANQVITDPRGTLLFASSDNARIKATAERWDRLNASPPQDEAEFAKIKTSIRSRLNPQV